MQVLEPRMLYSADPFGFSLSALSFTETDESTAAFSSVDDILLNIDDPIEPLSDKVADEVVFVDARLHDYELIVSALLSNDKSDRNIAVHLIKTGEDGVAIITSTLAQYIDLDAIHIITHGTDANVSLGNNQINTQSIEGQTSDLVAWGSALKDDGDLLLYGCDLASSDAGKLLIDELQRATGADVAASTDLTGHSSFGADWDLEYHSGEILTDTVVAEDADFNWKSILSVISVSTTNDVVDASGLSLSSVAALISDPGADGLISLREAILATEADAGSDEIQLSAGNYTLALGGAGDNGDLDISDDLIIRGVDSTTTIINGADLDRVFDMSGGVVEMEGLTITGGKSPTGEEAGGIRVAAGTLTLNDVALTDNTSTDIHGGAVYVESGATLFAYASLFFNNVADPDTSPSFRDGGAIYNLGNATLERVTFDSNVGDKGGAIHNHGTLNLTDVWLVNNTASFAGGGIDNHGGGTLNMEGVTFEGNSSAGAAGAVRTNGPTTINNSTFSGNNAVTDGGAILIDGGSVAVSISNSTFAFNTATSDGGAISTNSSNATFTNSLFASNFAGGSDDAINGSLTSLGFNLVMDGGYGGGVATDFIGVDPLLGALQDNGGYVKTHAVGAGSAAINAGGGSSAVDATGADQDEFPDIGAHESRLVGDQLRIYWTDASNNTIYRANGDGSAVQAIVSTAQTPYDIEVDIAGGKIYWVEGDDSYSDNGNLGRLMSANLDGSGDTPLRSNLLAPAGLALDTDAGHIYVTSDTTPVNDPPTDFANGIVRYDLDGTNAVQIASGNLADSGVNQMVAPNDVEYDPVAQKLYWTDRGYFIPVLNVVGREVKVLDLSTPSTPEHFYDTAFTGNDRLYGLAVIPGSDQVYWANGSGLTHVDSTGGSPVVNEDTAMSGSSVYGVEYDPESGLLYMADHAGRIVSVSTDLATVTDVVVGLGDPNALAIGGYSAVSLLSVVDVNTGATVDEHSSVEITPLMLHSDDADTTDSNIIYSVTTNPSNGQLVDSGDSPITSFTQQDIVDGEVWYKHSGSETLSDSFDFTVSDEAGTTPTNSFSVVVNPVNDLPAAVADNLTVDEGSTTTLNLASNDTDADVGDAVDLTSIAIVTGPGNGSIVVNNDGTVDYTHDGTETTTDSFTYTIDDLSGATSNTATVSLTVTPQNDPPTAVVDNLTVDEASTTTLDLASNDTDVDVGDAVDLTSIAIVTGPGNGSVVVNNDGTVAYTHNGTETTSDSFTYTIDDLGGTTSNTATVSLVVTPQNDPPVAVVDNLTVDEASTTTLDLASNDTDADVGDVVDLTSIAIVTGPGNGSVVVNNDGTVAYTHDGSETISDSFTYTIDDLGGTTSNTATVSLVVTPQNDPPVAVVDNLTVDEASTTTLDLASNDTDADVGDAVDLTSIAIVSGPGNGSVVVNNDGTVAYTHDGSETTSDSFTYTIDDLGGTTSNTATVSLVVTPQNDPPVAVVDNLTVDEASTTTLDLASNDTDADVGDVVDLTSIAIVTGPGNGSVVVNNDGTVAYTHDGSETISDSFTYTIDDLGGTTSNTATVSLVVTPQNDPPVAVVDNLTVDEASTTTLDLASNDTDADVGDAVDLTSIAIVSGPGNGSVVVNNDGTVAYTHDGSETTSDSFTYTIDDLGGTTSNTATVSLVVTPQNDPPVAVVDNLTVDEASTTTLDLASNDTDADVGDVVDLTSIAIVTGPGNGSVVVNNDGTVAYTHDGSETISDSFTYTIDDLGGTTSNTATVSLVVTPQNDPPVAVVDNLTVDEASTTTLDLASNDTDADVGDAVDLTSIAIVSGPGNGSVVVNNDGTVAYTHDGSETTSDSFTYTIDDLGGTTSNTATVSLVVTPQNDPPVAVVDNLTVDEASTTTLDLASNDTDADVGDVVDLTSIAIVTGPGNGSVVVNNDGTVAYTHDGSETISDSFTYTIDDLGGTTSNTATVSLVVTPQNDPPAAAVDNLTVNEASTTTLDLASNDTDVDAGDVVDLTSIAIVTGPNNGSVVVNNDGTVDYAHDGTETTSDSFTYTIDDLGGTTSNTATVSLVVTPQNDPPSAIIDNLTVNEASTTTLNLAANDTDADAGDVVDLTSIAIVTGPNNGSVVVNNDGTVSYTHDGTETTADSFTYTIDDLGGTTSNSATVSLVVTPQNDPPAAVVDNLTVDEASTTTLNLASNDTDIDAGDAIDLTSIAIVTGPNNGSVVVNNDGTVSYTHDGTETISDSFTYTIDDLSGTTSNPAMVSLLVTPQNDPPAAVVDNQTVNEASTTTLNLAANDTDADVGDAVDLTSIAIVTGPGNGSVVVNNDGTVAYTHDGTETTSDSFTYTIDDLGGTTSNIATVSLLVTPQNDPPVAVVDNRTVNEASTTTLDLASNDTDIDVGDAVDLTSIAIVAGPSNGSVVVNNDGTVAYTHNGTETTSDSFTYTIDDLGGTTSNTATVSLTVTPQNNPPTAAVDNLTVNEASTTTLDLASNDTDVDVGDAVDLTSIAIVAGPNNGSVVVNNDGTVAYTHDGTETTSDTFTYTIDDLGGTTSNTATVSLTVTPQNDPPAAVVDNRTVNEASTTTLNLASNDTDNDDGLDLASIEIVTGPQNGSLIVNNDGTVDYTHDGSETTTDSFNYTISDLSGVKSNLAAVSLMVTPQNDTPVAVLDMAVVDEGSTATLNLASNDTDDDDGLDLGSIAIVAGPAHGSLLINNDGTVDYTHDGSETTADSFTYTITDLNGAISNTIGVSLVITPQNDAPLAAIDNATVDEGSTITLNLTSNDSDDDDGIDPSSIAIVTEPSNGSLSINRNGTVNYTHDGSETTSDSFTYAVRDINGLTSNTQTVFLTVTPQNDAPVLAIVPESPLLVESFEFTLHEATFTDADADDLTYSATLESGEPLPDWLTFDATTLTFSASSAEIFDEDINILIVASDGGAEMASTVLVFRSVPAISAANSGIPQMEAEIPLAPVVADNIPQTKVPNTVTSAIAPLVEIDSEEVFQRIDKVENTEASLIASDVTQVNFASVETESFIESRDEKIIADDNQNDLNELLLDENSIPLDRLLDLDDHLTAAMFSTLSDSMDRSRDELTDGSVFSTKIVGTSIALSSSFSVGYLLWLVRGGLLVSSVLASVPTWRYFDPLPILDSLDDAGSEADTETLESMVNKEDNDKPDDRGRTDSSV